MQNDDNDVNRVIDSVTDIVSLTEDKNETLFDILFSFIGLLLLQPLFVVIAIMIKVDSAGQSFLDKEGRKEL